MCAPRECGRGACRGASRPKSDWARLHTLLRFRGPSLPPLSARAPAWQLRRPWLWPTEADRLERRMAPQQRFDMNAWTEDLKATCRVNRATWTKGWWCVHVGRHLKRQIDEECAGVYPGTRGVAGNLGRGDAYESRLGTMDTLGSMHMLDREGTLGSTHQAYRRSALNLWQGQLQLCGTLAVIEFREASAR